MKNQSHGLNVQNGKKKLQRKNDILAIMVLRILIILKKIQPKCAI